MRYNSDSDEAEIISEMQRNPNNIVPAIMIDVTDPTIITVKEFDGNGLVEVPSNQLSLIDRNMVQRVKSVGYHQIHKSRIQLSNETRQEKERMCDLLERRELRRENLNTSDETYLKNKLRTHAPNTKKRPNID